MKNAAVINSCNWGSTGKIALNLHKSLLSKGFASFFFYGRGKRSSEENVIRFETEIEVNIHYILASISGLQGFFSSLATKRLIKNLDDNSVDTVFLLSPHGYYLNEHMFFSYLRKKKITLIYIMIDEYPYLGKCTNEPLCDTYRTGEGYCPNIKKYPKSIFFNTCPRILEAKKKNYIGIRDNAFFVGPQFVVDSSKKSLLGKYMNLVALDEAIDINLYHPVETNELKEQLGVNDGTIIILCVAPGDKGVIYFEELALRLKDNPRYLFIHIGSSSHEMLQTNYIQIDFVQENTDLVKYYSIADLLLFPSLADTMSNTCLEALACGTPLLAFNISGMPYLLDETVGTIVPPRDVDAMQRVIAATQKKNKETINRCRSYAEKRYDGNRYADRLIEIAINKSI